MATQKNKRSKRTPIPPSVQSAVLLANRHACCVCQKVRVQIHHIDGNPDNNEPVNLATLCTDHHDMASMQIGLTKKLQPDQVFHYKITWEKRCAEDLMALCRDRVNYFVTLYKNPSRVRELFSRLSLAQRKRAIKILATSIADEEKEKKSEGGFGFQKIPRINQATRRCLDSALEGQLWPEWLPRVPGHPADPDLPFDLRPPNGMQAFHFFDLYIQVLTRILAISNHPVPLEDLYTVEDEELLNAVSGCLVSFRETSYSKGIESPSRSIEFPVGRIEFRRKRQSVLHKTELAIRNMYVFSDTAVENLNRSRVCGIGVFGGAVVEKSDSGTIYRLKVIPLLIGMGGFGQSDASGWAWRIK